MRTETLTLNHLGRAREFFITKSFSPQQATPYVTKIGETLRKRVLIILTCLT